MSLDPQPMNNPTHFLQTPSYKRAGFGLHFSAAFAIDISPSLPPSTTVAAGGAVESPKRSVVQNPHNIKYNGTIQGLKYIWRTEGFKGLFRGNGTNCARIVPNSAVKFFSYEQASKGILYLYRQQTGNVMSLPFKDAQLTPLLRLGAGACAGIIAMSATYPMDMVRGRLTVQTENSPYQYRGMFHALSTIPYVGLNFAVTGWLACGATAGTVGQTVAYPLDVIRRRMQMVGWSHAASIVTGDGRSKAPLEYTGMIDAFRKTVKYEGVRALYKGSVPNSVKVVPSISIAFVAYEQVKDLLGVEIRISD
ncbi:hypothetical protein H5410_050049 [Solanum commersonii]|uniref:Mitochondrial carrier protein n=1 Tax=Solanum commersonii TaxID=4109 RepID=A0A9J5WWV3_SOLCO|nr:hypothetical protein H5410_050049 [Solanum commersonii]